MQGKGTSEERKVDRRTYLKIAGGTIAGLVVGGVLGYVLKPVGERILTTTVKEIATTTVKETVTVTKTQTVTATVSPTPTVTVTPPTPTRPKPAVPTTIDYLIWTWAVEFQYGIVDRWNKIRGKEYPVRINELPQETYFEGAESRLITGVPTDVMFSDVYLQIIGYYNDWIIAVEDYFPEIRQYLTEFPEGYRPGLLVKNKMMGLHKYGAPTLFLYNEDYLRKAGIDEPPKTWEEVAEQATKIKERGIADRPCGAFFGSYGFWQTLYSFIAGFARSPDEIPMFDKEANPLFAHEDHPLFKALRFIVRAINIDKTWDPLSVTQGEPEDIMALGGGSWAFGWMPAYDFASINDPSQKAYPHIKQTLNPGSKYTSCWIRPINITTMCAKRGKDALQGAYEFMIYYSGKVNPETLEPDFKNGIYLVQKEAVIKVGDWTAISEVWTYPDVQEKVRKFADPKMLMEQDKYLFLHQMDPDPYVAPYWAKWSGGFGSGPARAELEALMLGQRGTSDNDIMNSLKTIEKLWLTMKKEHETKH